MRSSATNLLSFLLLSGLLGPLSLFGQDSLNVRKIDQLRLWTPVVGVQLMGENFAAVATSSTSGIMLLDVTDRSNPIDIGQIPYQSVFSLAVSDSTLYFGTQNFLNGEFYNKLQAADISTPSHPVLIDSVEGLVGGLKVWGDTLVATHKPFGLVLYDLTANEPFHTLDSIALTNPVRVAASGNYLAVSQELPPRLSIFTRLQSGEVNLDTTFEADHLMSCDFIGDYLLVADVDGFFVISLNEGYSTVWSTELDNYYEIYVHDSRAYLTSALPGIVSYDISDPTEPVYMGEYQVHRASMPFVVLDSTLFLGDGGSGVGIFNVSNPDSFVMLSRFEQPGPITDIHLLDTLLYTGGSDQRSTVWNCSNPLELEFLNRVFYGDGCLEFSTRDEFAYVISYQYMMRWAFYDPIDPYNDDEAWIEGTGYCTAPGLFGVTGGLYDASLDVLVNLGTEVLNIAQNDSLVVLATYYDTYVLAAGTYSVLGMLPLSSSDVAIKDDILYLARWEEGLEVVNISIPEQPTIIGHVDVPGDITRMTLTGDVLMTSLQSDGVRLWDVSIPTDPLLIGYYDSGNSAHDIELRDSIAFVADMYRLTVLDCSEALRLINAGPPRHLAVTTVDDSLRFSWWSANSATSYSLWSSNDPELPEEFYTLEAVTTDTFVTLPISNDLRKLFFVKAERE